MQLKHLSYLFLLSPLFSGMAQAAVSSQDFEAKTTQNLLNLCTASPEDPQAREAIHFCHGYLVGAFHFHQAEVAENNELKLVCFPEPKPSRDQAINLFIAWAQKHPEYLNEMPVETEFRFLTEKWPCKK